MAPISARGRRLTVSEMRITSADLAALCRLAFGTLRHTQRLHVHARTRATFEAMARQQLASAEAALRHA